MGLVRIEQGQLPGPDPMLGAAIAIALGPAGHDRQRICRMAVQPEGVGYEARGQQFGTAALGHGPIARPFGAGRRFVVILHVGALCEAAGQSLRGGIGGLRRDAEVFSKESVDLVHPADV